MIKELLNLLYEERLWVLGIFSLEKTKHRKTLLMEGAKKMDPEFSQWLHYRTRGNYQILKQSKWLLNIGERWFYCEHGQILEEVVQSGCKISIPIHIQNPDIDMSRTWSEQWVWSKQSPERPSKLNYSVNLGLKSISKSKSVLKEFH